MGAEPPPLERLNGLVLVDIAALNLQAEKKARETAREAAAVQKARAEAAKVADRLTAWNPNVFRMDGRVNTAEAVRNVNMMLRADPALKTRQDLEASQIQVQLAQLTESFRTGGMDYKDYQMLFHGQNQRYLAVSEGHDPEFATQLNQRETEELKRILGNPSQWGETGTVQVGRFTVEMSVDRPASTGNIGEMSTSTSTNTTSGSSSEHQSRSEHSRNRSIEMEAGANHEGPSVGGKVGGSEGTTSGTQNTQGRSESTSSTHTAETKNPGERQNTPLYATIRNEHGTSVVVNLGTVLVAQQK